MRRFLYQAKTLSPLLFTRPAELCDRLAGMIANETDRFRKAPNYEMMPLDQAVDHLQSVTHVRFQDYLHETHLYEIEQEVLQRLQGLPPKTPFPRKHSADPSLARACYALVRAFAPQIVVETGVAYGVTSALILKALSVNGSGQLYSIDLPASIDDSAKQYVGYAIPEALRTRWKLFLGSSRRILPGLLREIGEIDVFVHDSLHTFGNMTWEFQLARRYFKRQALLISDDITGNAAFSRMIDEANPDCWAVIHESNKKSAFGIAVFMDAVKPA